MRVVRVDPVAVYDNTYRVHSTGTGVRHSEKGTGRQIGTTILDFVLHRGGNVRIIQVDPVTFCGRPTKTCRGASWIGYAEHCRLAFRNRFLPGFRDGFVGFRVVLMGKCANHS